MTLPLASQCDVAAGVRELASSGAQDVKSVCERLEDILSSAHAANAGELPDDRRLRQVIRHAVLLLRGGIQVTGHVQFNPGRLYVERTAKSAGQVETTRLIVACESLLPDPRALRGYFAGPCVVLYWGPLRIREDDCDHGLVRENLTLSEQELVEYVENKAASRRCDRSTSARNAEQVREAESEIADAYARILSDPSYRRFPVSQESHPYRGPTLLVLPRLVKPSADKSILAHLTCQLRHLRANGFDALLLGVVDKQSLNVYLEEYDDGELVPHVNTHGYWVSGDEGVDPLLGTELEYRELAQECKRSRIEMIQDTVYATLGYLPQISRFSANRQHQRVPSVKTGKTQASLGNTESMLVQPWSGAFDEKMDRDDLSPEAFAKALVSCQSSCPYDLPRPNLYDTQTIEVVRSRTNWLENLAGVRARRIDMAKHLPITALTSIIEPSDGSADAWVLLEWWSTTYRDLCFAAFVSEREKGRVYLFDFPLAVAAQDIFIRENSFISIVQRLQRERTRWGVDLRQLIPAVVDHDKFFKPVFNGTPRSLAATVVMHVFATFLSANAPVVYVGFDDARAGVPEHVDYSSYSERLTRRTVSKLIDLEQENSPAVPLTEFFRLLRAHPFVSHWDGEAIEISGDVNYLVLSRCYWDPKRRQQRKIQAEFSREALPREKSVDILYRYGAGPSVTISSI